MSHKRAILSLIALVIALSVGPSAPAQGLRDMQFFAPPNLSTYSGPRKASEGFFFDAGLLGWSISSPEVTTIGQYSEQGRVVWYGPDEAQTATQNNSHDTSIFYSQFVTGERYEGGYIYGHQGLLFSGWRLNHQTQDVSTTHMSMIFDDRDWGGTLSLQHLVGDVGNGLTATEPLAVTFASALIRNRVETWGVELNYLLRSNQLHSGGYFEVFVGARYLEFNDEFSIHAYGDVVPVDISGETVSNIVLTSRPLDTDQEYLYVGTLANSTWYQEAENHIVGPQIGARWFNYYGRWKFSAEGRFFAGCNYQNLFQTGEVGSDLNPNTGLLNDPSLPGHVPEAFVPVALEATTFTHHDTEREWSPGVEVRADLEWQWTRHVSFGAGWSGMWLDGIARSSNLINYEFGTNSLMGIVTANNRQSVFMQGVNFRVVVNR